MCLFECSYVRVVVLQRATARTWKVRGQETVSSFHCDSSGIELRPSGLVALAFPVDMKTLFVTSPLFLN